MPATAGRATTSDRPGPGGRRTGAGPARPRRRATKARPVAVRAVVPVSTGAVWAVATLGSAALGRVVVALVLLPVAAVAAVTWSRTVTPRPRRRSSRRRSSPRSDEQLRRVVLAAAGPVLAPVAALAGPAAAVAAVLVGAVAALSVVPGPVRYTRAAVRVGLASVAPAAAAGGVVLAAGQGRGEVLLLVGAVLAYDAGAFVMGNARTALGGPVGVAAGWVCVAVVAVFGAAVLNPPFSGARPWVVFAAVALACAAGVRLGQSGIGSVRLPAVRRIDSMIVAAPVWVVAMTLVGHGG